MCSSSPKKGIITQKRVTEKAGQPEIQAWNMQVKSNNICMDEHNADVRMKKIEDLEKAEALRRHDRDKSIEERERNNKDKDRTHIAIEKANEDREWTNSLRELANDEIEVTNKDRERVNDERERNCPIKTMKGTQECSMNKWNFFVPILF
jgi:hypothetical protein